MASSRKTLDVDLITLRKVLVRGPNNSFIPSTSVLMSDGMGGTYWSLVSTVGTYPSFQQININSTIYSASPTSKTFSFMPGYGIGFTDAGPGSNGTYVYAKAFQTIAVQGQSSLTAFTSNVLTPSLTFSSLGGLQISTDTTHQVIYFNGGIKNFNILSNTSSFTKNITTPFTTFPITPMLSTRTFMGTGDITLTPSPTNTIFIGINGYTSAGYQGLSGEVFTLNSSILNRVSTLFVSKRDFGYSISSFSTNIGYQLSSYQISSTYLSLSTFANSNISTLSTLYTSLSTSVTLRISTLSSYYFAVNQSTLSTFIFNNLASTMRGYSTLHSSVTGNLTTGFSTFLSNYSYTTLQNNSTSVGLMFRISNLYSNAGTGPLSNSIFILSTTLSNATVNSRLFFSTMSTTMTSTFVSLFTPKKSIVSSLGFLGTRGDGVRFTISNTGIYLSTLSMNLSTSITLINSLSTNVSLEYSPVLLFPMALNANVAPQLISTFISYQSTIPGAPPTLTNTIIPNTTFTDYMTWNQYALGGSAYVSNVYSKYIRLGISTGFLLNNTSGTYNVCHALPTAATNITAATTMHIRNPLQNSAFLNIFN
jgi:hypothetical protein